MNYTQRELLALLLDYADNLPNGAKARLAEQFATADALLEAAAEESAELERLLNGQSVPRVWTSPGLERILNGLKHSGTGFTTIESPNYPECFSRLSDPPVILYYRGELSVLSRRCVGVVGTRRCTTAGIRAAEKFAGVLAEHDFVVVSGMAEGIDTAAHRGALSAGGVTVGILGGGLDCIYPASNFQLCRDAVERGGLLLSELRCDRKPQRFTFPLRNRLIAAVSEAVLLCESPEKSGAIITAERALEQSKPVYALPGDVLSPACAGGNRWILEHGDSLVISPGYLMEKLGVDVEEEPQSQNTSLTPREQMILAAIRAGSTRFDQLLAATGLVPAELNEALSVMTIEGLVMKRAGNEYFI